MSRKIILKVDTTVNQLSVLDYDDETNKPNNGGPGSFGGWQANAINNVDLTDLSARISLRNSKGDAIGEFVHAEIEIMEINGDDVAASCTNLNEVLAVFGPYLFSDEAPILLNKTVTGIVGTYGSLDGALDLEKDYDVIGAKAITVLFNVAASINQVDFKLMGSLDGVTWITYAARSEAFIFAPTAFTMSYAHDPASVSGQNDIFRYFRIFILDTATPPQTFTSSFTVIALR